MAASTTLHRVVANRWTTLGEPVRGDLRAGPPVSYHKPIPTVTSARWAERQRVRLSGVGHYRAEALASREAEVSLSSVGTATVRVRDYLNAQVTGSGTIYYYGNPVVDEHVVGSGSVERLGG